MIAQSQGSRLIWFPSPRVEIDAVRFFEDLTGAEPDNIRKNKNPTQSNPSLYSVEGEFEKISAGVNYQLGRLEFVLSPNPDIEYETIPLLSVQDSLKMLRECVGRATNLPESMRLSCIFSKYLPTDSQEQAAELFSEVVGCEIKVPNASDQVFQINRRSSFSGHQFNRVTSVSVVTTQTLKIIAGISHGQIIDTGINITYDFNTVPGGGIFSIDEQRKVFPALLNEVERAASFKNLDFLLD